MFRSQLFDHPQGVVFRAYCCYYFSACLPRQVIWYVAVCCLCVCLPDVLVCEMFGCELTTKHPTDKYIRHAHT
jgi:hypothetical protein